MMLALYHYRLPLVRPLVLRGRREMARQGLLVCVEGQWGEIAPLPGFSRESLAEAMTETLDCLRTLHQGKPASPRLPSVQFGLDCARRCWPPRLDLPLPDSYQLIHDFPLEQPGGERAWPPRLPTKAKLKVARHPMDDELALIRRLCARYPTLKLVLDANQGWTREQAMTFCDRLEANRIEYLEDPCADFEDIAFVAAHTGIPVALDELLVQGKPWEPIAQLVALVLKPTLLGSLAHSEALATQARKLELQIVISSSFESDLGLDQLARLATEWAPEQAPGLDTRHWLAHGLLDSHGQPRLEPLTCLYRHE